MEDDGGGCGVPAPARAHAHPSARARWRVQVSDDEFYDCNVAMLEAEGYLADAMSTRAGKLVRVANVVVTEGLGMAHLKLIGRINKV